MESIITNRPSSFKSYQSQEMSSQIDCPICMDVIEVSRNCVTTECGHCFHTNCLMQSVAHNGFGCPYCRTVMAEEPKEEEESDDGYGYEEDASIFDEDALTSFRMFHQRLNGEEVEEVEEAEDWESVDEEDEDELPAEPDAAYVAQKLAERGITFEDLVKNILVGDHSDFGNLYTDYERRSSEVYGQFRAIISRYESQIVEPTTLPPTPPPTPAPTPEPEKPISVDYEAQPKLTRINFIRQASCC